MPRSETLRVSPLTLLAEARAGITQRPGRSALTALGTVIGVAVLIGVLALTSSAAVQVSRQFDLQEATLVRVVIEDPEATQLGGLRFDADAPDRVRKINGVKHAMVFWNDISRPALNPPAAPRAGVIAASSGLTDVAVPSFAQGIGFDEGHEARKARVAVVGVGAARDLNLGDVSRGASVEIDGMRFTVVGIVSDVERFPEILNSVVIPSSTALELWGDPPREAPVTMAVAVAPGAAQAVGQQAPLAISATHPDRFRAELPPDPRSLRQSVNNQLAGLFIMLAGVCLVVGVVGIANTTFVAVIERTGEIGLRRAMGARSADITTQFMLEAAILGFLGGLAGAAVAVLAVVAICLSLGWTVVIPLWLVVGGPVAGLLSGLVGGLVPSLRASRIEPVEALRS